MSDEIEQLDAQPSEREKPPEGEQLVNFSISSEFTGPLPHPAILAAYDSVASGTAQKLIDNSLEESEHRRRLQRHESQRKSYSLWVASIIAILIVALGGVGFTVGHPWPGTVLVSSGLAAATGVFVRFAKHSQGASNTVLCLY